MAHAVYIKSDTFGEVTDVLWFCSDFCARRHASYDGWNGCLENYSEPFCQDEVCQAPLHWFNENESLWFYGNTPKAEAI